MSLCISGVIAACSRTTAEAIPTRSMRVAPINWAAVDNWRQFRFGKRCSRAATSQIRSSRSQQSLAPLMHNTSRSDSGENVRTSTPATLAASASSKARSHPVANENHGRPAPSADRHSKGLLGQQMIFWLSPENTPSVFGLTRMRARLPHGCCRRENRAMAERHQELSSANDVRPMNQQIQVSGFPKPGISVNRRGQHWPLEWGDRDTCCIKSGQQAAKLARQIQASPSVGVSKCC